MYCKSAELSDCETYRYVLGRAWELSAPCMNFIMVNPSTADAEHDDATIRKCVGFARGMGYGSIEVTNLFAFRATEVKDLRDCLEPVGPDNDRHIRDALSRSNLTVCAWGSRAKLPKYLHPRISTVKSIIAERGTTPRHLGLTKSGDPKHPLMIPYKQRMERWHYDVL